MLINKEFRIVSGLEDYIINCDGTECRTVDKIIYDEKYKFTWIRKGRQLKQSGWGEYLRYVVHKDGKKLTISTHVLVCLAWNGPRPPGKYWALHKNDDRTNNHYTNLYWGTPSNNIRDAIRNGKHIYRSGFGSTAAKFVEEQVLEIKKRIENGDDDYEVAFDYNVSWQTIRNIRRGFTYK
jgi:hypothetical protein